MASSGEKGFLPESSLVWRRWLIYTHLQQQPNQSCLCDTWTAVKLLSIATLLLYATAVPEARVFVVGLEPPAVVHSLSVTSVVLGMMPLPGDEDREVPAWSQVPEWGGSSLWWRNRPTTERRATQEVGAGLPSKLHLEDHFWRFWALRMSIPALLPFKGVLDLLGIRMKEPNMIWDEIPLLEDSELSKEKVFGKGCMLCDGFPPVEMDRGVRMSVAPGADEASDQLPALLPPVWNIQVQLQQFLAVYSWCTKEFQSLPTMLPQNDGERLLQVLGKSNVLGLEAGVLQCSCGSCIPSPNAWHQANCSVKHLP